MKIFFDKATFSVPEPVPHDSEILIRVEAVWIIPTREQPILPAYPNRLAKMIFFVVHEGMLMTWRKTRSVMLRKRIIGHQKIVLVEGLRVSDAMPVIAVGVQPFPGASFMCFPTQYVAEARFTKDEVHQLRDKLETRFKESPELFEEVLYYSPFSGRRLEHTLAEVCPEAILSQATPISGLSSDRPDDSDAPPRPDGHSAVIDVFVAGAGSYVLSYVLPHFRSRRFRLHTVVDLNLLRACLVGRQYGFAHADTSTGRALKRLGECSRPLLIIATYHSTHVSVAEEALHYNPETCVFMEKPPVTSLEQLGPLVALRENSFIQIGYNRRYAPFVRRAKRHLENVTGPTTITCTVKELPIPLSHWYYWPSQGTRITGNLSHWVDLGIHFISAAPRIINIQSTSAFHYADEIAASVSFEDGSLLTLIASDRGNATRGVQECIEIRRGGITVRIDDFLRMSVQNGGSERRMARMIRDKGHAGMYRALISGLHATDQRKDLYSNLDLTTSSTVYLTMVNMLRKGETTHRFHSNRSN